MIYLIEEDEKNIRGIIVARYEQAITGMLSTPAEMK
jgi:hypothetical protein